MTKSLTLSRRALIAGAATAVASPAILSTGYAQAPEVTLRMHHFLPPVSNGHAKFLRPWADKVQTESNGRIKIDIFPSMQLGGAPPQLFDQAKRRRRRHRLDFARQHARPLSRRSEAMELPFIGGKRGVTNSKVNSRALQEYADAILAYKEYSRRSSRSASGRTTTVSSIPTRRSRASPTSQRPQAALPHPPRRRGAEGARRQRHRHADPAGAGGDGAARHRRRGHPLGGGAGPARCRSWSSSTPRSPARRRSTPRPSSSR